MKIVAAFLMFIAFGIVANAQQAKVLTELAASADKTVKNSPFSADAVSESVQTLADGNRIVRNSTSKLYRNSEGRFRREMTGGSGGMLGSLYTTAHGVSIMDPIGGFRYMIDPNLKTTRQFIFKPGSELRVVGTGAEGGVISQKLRDEIKAAAAAKGTNTVDAAELSEKIREELKIATTVVAPTVEVKPTVALAPLAAVEGMHGVAMAYHAAASGQNKWDTRTDELGTQNIEGVNAEGTRTITTIPAGAIGNERPIEITYEKWYSRDLQMVVMSKHNDPRFGEQTYRLTNIVRSEPDPSLFAPPQGYRMITEPTKGSYSYTINAANRAIAAEKAVASPRAVQTTNAAKKP